MGETPRISTAVSGAFAAVGAFLFLRWLARPMTESLRVAKEKASIRDLKYRAYRHSRDMHPTDAPEKWLALLGASTLARYEARYQGERKSNP